jgi:hypothetical protein
MYGVYKKVIRTLDGWITEGEPSKTTRAAFEYLLTVMCSSPIRYGIVLPRLHRFAGGKIIMPRLEVLLQELGSVDLQHFAEETENMRWLSAKRGKNLGDEIRSAASVGWLKRVGRGCLCACIFYSLFPPCSLLTFFF